MGIKNNYTVKSIDNFQCKDWITHKHYAKRMPPISYAFGIFNLDNNLIGICSFGRPISNPLKIGVCGEQYSEFVYELNRLVINETDEKNILSFFVSKCLSMLPKPMIIVSYADTSQNHHGYIYQATNFIYTGLSAEFDDYAIEGMEHLHNATVFEKTKRGSKNRVEQLKAKFGDKLYSKPRDRKHRYIYFLGTRNQKLNFNKSLNYKIEPYPKGENKRYDASYKPTIQKQLF